MLSVTNDIINILNNVDGIRAGRINKLAIRLERD